MLTISPIVSKKSRTAFVITLAFTFILVFCAWNKLPIVDPVHYFNFADQRLFLGIPNGFDVLTNILFVLVGFFGLWFVLNNKNLHKSFYYYVGIWLSLSIVFTGIGSAYFHWSPVPETLTWDRLPMTLAFTGLCSLVGGDRFGARIGWAVFAILLPLGPLSVFAYKMNYWTLRPYAALQLATVFFVLISVIIKPQGKIPNALFYWALILYVLAKIFETYDHQVFDFLSHSLSGHSLKHMLAALALYKILSFFKKKIEN